LDRAVKILCVVWAFILDLLGVTWYRVILAGASLTCMASARRGGCGCDVCANLRPEGPHMT